MMCSTQAKFAFPVGGTPYFQRLSSRNSSPRQSLTLNGGLARMKSALRSGCLIVEGVAVRDQAVDPADREIHHRQAPSRVVRLLSVDGDVGLGLAAVPVPL